MDDSPYPAPFGTNHFAHRNRDGDVWIPVMFSSYEACFADEDYLED